MCLQSLSLKDPDRCFLQFQVHFSAVEHNLSDVNVRRRLWCSQELLKAVWRERVLRRNKTHAANVYRRNPVEEYDYDRVSSCAGSTFNCE